MEKSIRARFAAVDIRRGTIRLRIFDSLTPRREAGVQVSDVVVGLLGKMFTYFTQTDREQIAKDRMDLRESLLLNAEYLRCCISMSPRCESRFSSITLPAMPTSKS